MVIFDILTDFLAKNLDGHHQTHVLHFIFRGQEGKKKNKTPTLTRIFEEKYCDHKDEKQWSKEPDIRYLTIYFDTKNVRKGGITLWEPGAGTSYIHLQFIGTRNLLRFEDSTLYEMQCLQTFRTFWVEGNTKAMERQSSELQ